MFCSLSWLLYGFSRVTWQSCLEAVWSDNSDLKPSSKTAHRPANVIYNRELRIGNELTSDLQGEKRLSRSLHTLIIKAPNSSLGGYQTLPRRLLFILEQQGKPSSQSRLNCAQYARKADFTMWLGLLGMCHMALCRLWHFNRRQKAYVRMHSWTPAWPNWSWEKWKTTSWNSRPNWPSIP